MKTAFTLLLSAFLLTLSLSACSGQEISLEQKSYTPGTAELHGIHIQAVDREILVVPSNDGTLRMEYAESSKEFYDISISDEGILSMVLQSDKKWTDYIGWNSAAETDPITVYLPDACLSSLELHTTKKDILLSAPCATKQLILTANGGDISFESIYAADSILIENKNGAISGNIAGSYDDYTITCSIKKGKSNLPAEKANGNKTLRVTNNNGNIDVAFTGQPT